MPEPRVRKRPLYLLLPVYTVQCTSTIKKQINQIIAFIGLCLSVSVQKCICARGRIRLKLVSNLLPSSSKVPTQKSVAWISTSVSGLGEQLSEASLLAGPGPHRRNASFLCQSHSSRESSSYICPLVMWLLANLKKLEVSGLFVLSWCILQTTTTSWRGLQSQGVPLTRPSWPSCAHTKWGSSGRIFTQFGRIFGLFCRISRHGKVALIWEIRLVTCFIDLEVL